AVVRFAWHLTSVAWAGLAATLVGVEPALAVGVVCLVNAGTVLWMLPGHVAWPPFLGAGVLALWAAGALPVPLLRGVVGVAVLGALVAAGFHLTWAVGLRGGAARVVPQRAEDGEPLFRPGPVPTLGVAVALAAFAAVLVARASGTGGALVLWADVAALVVLTLRVMGEGRWVGVTKSVRGTA